MPSTSLTPLLVVRVVFTPCVRCGLRTTAKVPSNEPVSSIVAAHELTLAPAASAHGLTRSQATRRRACSSARCNSEMRVARRSLRPCHVQWRTTKPRAASAFARSRSFSKLMGFACQANPSASMTTFVPGKRKSSRLHRPATRSEVCRVGRGSPSVSINSITRASSSLSVGPSPPSKARSIDRSSRTPRRPFERMTSRRSSSSDSRFRASTKSTAARTSEAASVAARSSSVLLSVVTLIPR